MAGSILTSDLPCAELDDDHGVSQMNCQSQCFFSMSKNNSKLHPFAAILESEGELFTAPIIIDGPPLERL